MGIAMEDQSVLIVGTGALACLFASRLPAAGASVTMLGTWEAGLQALQRHGVRVEAAERSERVSRECAYPVKATADPGACAGVRLALVLVKSWQTARVAAQLAQCLSPEGVALTLQNGLGNRETLTDALGADRVALGVTTTGATLLGPGRVRPGGEGSVSVGIHPRLDPLVDILRQAGFTVEQVGQADDLLWSKLVINAAINPLTALLRVPNGELLRRPSARALMAQLAREATAVARALGRQLTYPNSVATAEDVARRTAVNHSSMFQDVQRGAPTEIDAICGAIVSVGEQQGVPTPVNRTLWRLVKASLEGVGEKEREGERKYANRDSLS